MPEHPSIRCLFCGRSAPDVKMTKEHVLRSWFQRFMETDNEGYAYVGMHRADDSNEVQLTERNIVASPWQLTVREVCKNCNTVLLNELIEKPIEDTLLAMMLAIPIVLLPTGSRAVATWAAKTAVVREAQDRGRRAITPNAAAHIVERLEPPPYTFVLAGLAEAPPNTFSRHIRLEFTFESVLDSCHVTTFILGECSCRSWVPVSNPSLI